MVSKIMKKTPTKTTKDRRSRRRKRSPITNIAAASSIVVASINKSIYTCHRHLIKIFSKLARIGTPKNPRKQGYKILKKVPQPQDINQSRRSLFFGNRLPRSMLPEKKTIFLDLDETLVHSKPEPPPEKYDFIVRPVIDGEKVNFYVLKRPFVDEFLESLSQKFEIVVFTAGIEEYASLVVDRIDRKAVISHRLYRDSCKEVNGKFVKDLSDLGRDLRSVVIIDDNPNSYSLQPENAIPVRPFTNDLSDGELRRLIEFFEGSVCFEDMRDAVKHYLAEEDHKLEM
uniref:Putative C-terminal domain small phosphatase n=1 Tax=Davidia involucrata TaxID=16924 RepID=A0A5B7CA86_DAVIN